MSNNDIRSDRSSILVEVFEWKIKMLETDLLGAFDYERDGINSEIFAYTEILQDLRNEEARSALH